MSDFDDLIAEIEIEAQQRGPQAVKELRAFEKYFIEVADKLKQKTCTHFARHDTQAYCPSCYKRMY